MHYYQHHIGDFIRDTSRLTDAQCMAYLRMIWMYYDTEQPLPDNPRIIAFKIGASEIDVQLILEAFFELADGLWHHSRCDEEIASYWKFCGAQKEKGKRGGRPKKNQTESQLKPEENPAGFHGVTDGNPEESPRNPNHKPITNISIPDGIDNINAPSLSPTRAGTLCRVLRRIGIQAAPHMLAHPDWQAILDRFDDEAIIGAAELARANNPKARITINYLVPILNDPPKPPPMASPGQPRRATSGRQAAIDNYAAQAAAARGEGYGQEQAAGERDITGQCERVE